jgi:hypothetical protein
MLASSSLSSTVSSSLVCVPWLTPLPDPPSPVYTLSLRGRERPVSCAFSVGSSFSSWAGAEEGGAGEGSGGAGGGDGGDDSADRVFSPNLLSAALHQLFFSFGGASGVEPCGVSSPFV